MSQFKSSKTPRYRFGELCRSLDGGKPCEFSHSAPLKSSTPCKFGERCRSLSGGKSCKFDHQPSPETLKIHEMTKFMTEQGLLHRHQTPIVCAIQYSRHAYAPPEKANQTVYTTIDGTVVFINGVPIDENHAFSNCHRGAMGQSYGGLEGNSIVSTVRKMYFDWYTQHVFPETILQKLSDDIPIDGLFTRPAPLEAHATYCGN